MVGKEDPMPTAQIHHLQPKLAFLVKEFDAYLDTVKNLSVTTRECYCRHTRQFLIDVDAAFPDIEIGELTRNWIRTYVTGLSARCSPESVKLIATCIRSFLRFAYVRDIISEDLSAAVGIVITHRHGRLPRALSTSELDQLLATPNRLAPTGKRDFSVLTLLSRLGLRAGEVAHLKLADFHWRSGTVAVRVKGNTYLTLPLPFDVGQSVVDYLRTRPSSGYEEMFLTVRSHPRPLTRTSVTAIVAQCAKKAGLGIVHAHRLRHTAARAILAAGGNLTEVGQLLGHSTPQITMMYASFDFKSARHLARPWPSGADHA